eukprot:RCo017837
MPPLETCLPSSGAMDISAPLKVDDPPDNPQRVPTDVWVVAVRSIAAQRIRDFLRRLPSSAMYVRWTASRLSSPRRRRENALEARAIQREASVAAAVEHWRLLEERMREDFNHKLEKEASVEGDLRNMMRLSELSIPDTTKLIVARSLYIKEEAAFLKLHGHAQGAKFTFAPGLPQLLSAWRDLHQVRHHARSRSGSRSRSPHFSRQSSSIVLASRDHSPATPRTEVLFPRQPLQGSPWQSPRARL